MQRFIDPKALARVRDLPLVARAVADGFLHGLQASEQRGVGIEFNQYRSYEPGDAPGRIDWKLYARSDRYFVREAERESEINIWLVLDCSHSMAQASAYANTHASGTRAGGSWRKFDYARHLVATLAYLAQRQGDRVGYLGLDGIGPEGPGSVLLPAQPGQQQWHRILRTLQGSEPAGSFGGGTGTEGALDPAHSSAESSATVGATAAGAAGAVGGRATGRRPGSAASEPPALAAYLNRLQAPGLVLLISDLHQHGEEIEGFVRSAATTRNELAVLQLSCEDELSFPYTGPVCFEDLETGEQVLAQGRAARAQYLAAREAYQTRLRKTLSDAGVSLDTLNIDQPLDYALHAFLQRRRRHVGPARRV